MEKVALQTHLCPGHCKEMLNRLEVSGGTWAERGVCYPKDKKQIGDNDAMAWKLPRREAGET